MSDQIVFSWSGGKDSAMALYLLCTDQQYQPYSVVSLLTTLTEGYDRISGHGVRRNLLERQTGSLGLGLQFDLHEMYIPQVSTMDEYETRMEAALREHAERGTNFVAFGDIYLKGLKKQRVNGLRKLSMTGLFPIWQRDSYEYSKTLIELGFKSVVVCVDSKALDASFIGKCFDQDFLDRLPAGVDPCGENGEFHTFVFDGPIFREPVKYSLGEVVLRDAFYYCDVLPAG